MKTAIIIIALCLFIGFPAVSNAISLGPYSGTVLDSQSGEPIEGASVFFYWTKVIPNVGGGNSETIGCKLIYTDSKGRYDIPKYNYNIGLMAFFESTRIIIYQPGYQAYTRDIEKDNPYWKPDPSFKEIENTVELKRIPPNFSHEKHYSTIDSALWGLDSVEYPDPERGGLKISWDTFIDRNFKSGVLEKAEFLRRVEWERERGRQEDER